MQRREALALLAASTVPLAGCSSSGDGGNETNGSPSTNGTPTDNSSEDPTDNTTDPSDDGNSSGGDDGDDDPTEEELAQEDVDAAQSALEEAVVELESQGTAYGSLSDGSSGPPVTAALSNLSAGPVRDQLSSVQSAIDDANEHETTSDQDDTLTAIEAVKDWMHAVLDAFQPVRDLYLEANYAVEALAADNEPDVSAIEQVASQAEPVVDEIGASGYSLGEGDLNRVDAVAWGSFETQTERLETAFSSGEWIVTAIEEIQSAEDNFWPGRDAYQNGEGDSVDVGNLADARDLYGSAAGIADVELSTDFSAAADYLTCYGGEMQVAADEYYWAVQEWKGNAVEAANQHADAGEAAIDEADACSFEWSA